MNNVMSNFFMADWHDVGAAHVNKALRIILAAHDRQGKGVLGNVGNAATAYGIADRDAAMAVLNRYRDAGGEIGSWATQELKREQLDPLLAALADELGTTADGALDARVGVFSALQYMLHGRLPSAYKALAGTWGAKAVSNEAKSLIDLYQTEDEVFRLAAWLKAKEEGHTDIKAGEAARRSFLDYHINAPWINAMRNSAIPFISYTYRAVPMLLEVAGKKPHKLLKAMAVIGAINLLGTMLSGGDDDEDRKMLPEEKSGKVLGLVPKLVRMPWNDRHGAPVFLDIRRFIPLGDVFDVGQGHSALPIPPSLMPGGPVALAGEIIANKSMFTGKPITLETDTPKEQAAKITDYLFKSFAPNLLGVPGTYATTAVEQAYAGRTDSFGRELSVAQAIAGSLGVKLGSYPPDVLRMNLSIKAKAEITEIEHTIWGMARQVQTNRMTQAEFAKQIEYQRDKIRKVVTELREKVAQ